MAKVVNDSVLDAALNQVYNNVNMIYIVSTSESLHLWTVISNYALASTTLISSMFVSTISDGGVGGGRKLAIPAVNDILIDNTGSAYSVVLIDTARVTDARVLYATTCTAKSLTSQDRVNVPTWDIQLTDPTA